MMRVSRSRVIRRLVRFQTRSVSSLLRYLATNSPFSLPLGHAVQGLDTAIREQASVVLATGHTAIGADMSGAITCSAMPLGIDIFGGARMAPLTGRVYLFGYIAVFGQRYLPS
jgi:hypothetical protein